MFTRHLLTAVSGLSRYERWAWWSRCAR